MREFKVGDRVTPVADPYGDLGIPNDTKGRVFVITKVNKVNNKASAEDGGRGINFPDAILAPATDENVAAGRGSLNGSRPYVAREEYDTGAIVTLKRAWRGISTDDPFVVVKDGGGKTVRIVKLGGDAGRYLRIPPTGLVTRDVEWLAERLVETVTV
jgi:hypothetical protein